MRHSITCIALSSCTRGTIFFVLLLGGLASALRAQEKPYFVTYSQDMEEPGNLEIETKNAFGQPADSNSFGASALELEYGRERCVDRIFVCARAAVAVCRDERAWFGSRGEVAAIGFRAASKREERSGVLPRARGSRIANVFLEEALARGRSREIRGSGGAYHCGNRPWVSGKRWSDRGSSIARLQRCG